MVTYYTDAFDGTLDTPLVSHTTDTGSGSYTELTTSGGVANAIKLSGDGCIYRPAAPNVMALPAGTPADVQLDAVINVKSLLTVDGVFLYARAVDGANHYYGYVNRSGAGIYKVVTSTATPFTLDQGATSVAQAVTAGTTPKLSFRVVGNKLALLWNDTVIASVTDTNNTFTAAGRCGIKVGYGTSTVQTSSTGMQPTSFTVADPPPTNTIAPAISGTPQSGQTLTCSTGTWTGSPTGYTYKPQTSPDGTTWTDAAAASSTNTYIVASGDVGKQIRFVVAATNGQGTSTATSNTVTATSGLPVNTVAPALTTDGTPQQGETVTADNGSWTNNPTSYLHKWQRDSDGTGATFNDISGATAASYTLTSTDVGRQVRHGVAAVNGAGTTAYSYSSAVTVTAQPALAASDIKPYLSGGASNSVLSSSIGGTMSSVVAPGGANGYFDAIAGSVAAAGAVFYHVFYIKNTHLTATLQAAKAFIANQFTASGLEVAIAAPTEAKNTPVAALANQNTPPSGVSWVTSSDPTAGAALGDLGPGEYRGLHVRLTVGAGTGQVDAADYSFDVQGTPA